MRMVAAVRRLALAADPDGAKLLRGPSQRGDLARRRFAEQGYVVLPGAADAAALAPLGPQGVGHEQLLEQPVAAVPRAARSDLCPARPGVNASSLL